MRLRRGLASRLLVAQLLVLVAAVVTAWLLAAAVGPTLFRDHLGQVDRDATADEAATHAEKAFRDASVISLGVALVVALVVALAVSAYVTRRITRPVVDLAEAAADLAAAHYEVSVPAPGLGDEFDSLARSFDVMATRLRQVETTRRRLLGDLGHEMRTPVATLDGYLEAFEDGVAAADTSTLAMLRDQTRRLARLAEDVTAVSRAEEGQVTLHMDATSPEDLVAAAVAAAGGRYAEAGVALTAQVEQGAPRVLVDRARLAQVLDNLLDNAVRHTPAGGSVSVSAAADGDAVRISVTDTGDGIPTEHLPHLFERFYRVDPARDRKHGGSGVGLTIASALVRAHGGTLDAASPGPGQGSVLTVRLPTDPAATPGPGTVGALTVHHTPRTS